MANADAIVVLALVLTSCAAPSVHDGRSSECGTCHTQQFDEWKTSRHALSGNSPVFLAMLPKVEASWGRNARAQCVTCHQPGHAEEKFIGCASCHLAVGNREDANGAMVVDVRAPVATPKVPSSRAPHSLTQRRFFDAPNLCGTCHEVKGPGHLDEPTLTEFFASPVEAGQTCTSCHFETGHRFVGLTPAWGASAEVRARAEEAAVALLRRALKLEVQGDEVRLTNVGAAHGVPTGMTAVRDVWGDVSVVVNGVRTEYPRVLQLGARLESASGEVALFTDATRITSRSLAAGQSRTWRIPPGTQSVTVTLRARAIREETLRALNITEDVPVLEVAVVTR